MKNGWFRVYRNIFDCPMFQDTATLSIWLYLLAHATHDCCNVFTYGKNIELHAGQLVTNRTMIAKHFNLNESKVQRTLERLTNERLIERTILHNFQVITILNWDMYRTCERQSERQTNAKVNAMQKEKEAKRKDNKNIERQKYIINKLNSAGVTEKYPNYCKLQEVVDYISNANCFGNVITIQGEKYTSEDFDNMICKMSVDTLFRVANKMLMRKDSIRNRSAYAIATFVDEVRYDI